MGSKQSDGEYLELNRFLYSTMLEDTEFITLILNEIIKIVTQFNTRKVEKQCLNKIESVLGGRLHY